MEDKLFCKYVFYGADTYTGGVMNKEQYTVIEKYMLVCMEDSAHDKEHIYRVLYNAILLAKSEEDVNYDVLITACLLHDIGRKEQYENSELCHAVVGADKAFRFLINNGFDLNFAEKVKECIRSHRYRKTTPPQSIEAKILFDADKLDVVGAIGIARTLLYQGIVSDPLYTVLPDGTISDGTNDTSPSFFYEYKYKLENLYSGFYTEKAASIALERKKIASDFYYGLYDEVNSSYETGRKLLETIVI